MLHNEIKDPSDILLIINLLIKHYFITFIIISLSIVIGIFIYNEHDKLNKLNHKLETVISIEDQVNINSNNFFYDYSLIEQINKKLTISFGNIPNFQDIIQGIDVSWSDSPLMLLYSNLKKYKILNDIIINNEDIFSKFKNEDSIEEFIKKITSNTELITEEDLKLNLKGNLKFSSIKLNLISKNPSNHSYAIERILKEISNKIVVDRIDNYEKYINSNHELIDNYLIQINKLYNSLENMMDVADDANRGKIIEQLTNLERDLVILQNIKFYLNNNNKKNYKLNFTNISLPSAKTFVNGVSNKFQFYQYILVSFFGGLFISIIFLTTRYLIKFNDQQ